jgi:hypothetical protein
VRAFTAPTACATYGITSKVAFISDGSFTYLYSFDTETLRGRKHDSPSLSTVIHSDSLLIDTPDHFDLITNSGTTQIPHPPGPSLTLTPDPLSPSRVFFTTAGDRLSLMRAHSPSPTFLEIGRNIESFDVSSTHIVTLESDFLICRARQNASIKPLWRHHRDCFFQFTHFFIDDDYLHVFDSDDQMLWVYPILNPDPHRPIQTVNGILHVWKSERLVLLTHGGSLVVRGVQFASAPIIAAAADATRLVTWRAVDAPPTVHRLPEAIENDAAKDEVAFSLVVAARDAADSAHHQTGLARSDFGAQSRDFLDVPRRVQKLSGAVDALAGMARELVLGGGRKVSLMDCLALVAAGQPERAVRAALGLPAAVFVDFCGYAGIEELLAVIGPVHVDRVVRKVAAAFDPADRASIEIMMRIMRAAREVDREVRHEILGRLRADEAAGGIAGELEALLLSSRGNAQ